MMQFNLCMADCSGNSKNCLYPFPITVTDADVLRAAATMDHVCGTYKNNYRSLDNFLWSDVAVMDCDNDHSDNPADWLTPVPTTSMLILWTDTLFLISRWAFRWSRRCGA